MDLQLEEQQFFANYSLSSIFVFTVRQDIEKILKLFFILTQYIKSFNNFYILIVSSRYTERNNPLHLYHPTHQIGIKQIPDIENQEVPFEEGSIQEQVSQHNLSNPITSSEKKSQIQHPNNEIKEPQIRIQKERQSQFVPEADEQKNFLQLIRRKKLLQKFISKTRQKAYIFSYSQSTLNLDLMISLNKLHKITLINNNYQQSNLRNYNSNNTFQRINKIFKMQTIMKS